MSEWKQHLLEGDESIIDHDSLLNFTSSEHFTEASIDHINIQNIGTSSHAQIDTHLTNSNQAHSDYLKNDADDTSSAKITALNFEVTGDNTSSDTSYVPMFLFGTSATPPAASGFPKGTIYGQYTQ